MTFILDDGAHQADATKQFIRDLCEAMMPRFLAETVFGVQLPPSEVELQMKDAALSRLKAAS